MVAVVRPWADTATSRCQRWFTGLEERPCAPVLRESAARRAGPGRCGTGRRLLACLDPHPKAAATTGHSRLAAVWTVRLHAARGLGWSAMRHCRDQAHPETGARHWTSRLLGALHDVIAGQCARQALISPMVAQGDPTILNSSPWPAPRRRRLPITRSTVSAPAVASHWPQPGTRLAPRQCSRRLPSATAMWW
jgi:hypothetical protein